jgi:hypothetical protein
MTSRRRPNEREEPRTRKFMAHEPGFTIIDARNRLFPAWFDGESCWDAWWVILKRVCVAGDEGRGRVLPDHCGRS